MSNSQQSAQIKALENPQHLLPVAEQAVETARRAGAEFADASASISKDLTVVIEKSSIKSAELVWSRHFSIRAYLGGGMGYVSSSGFQNTDIIELAQRATELARLASPDPDFVALPGPEQPEQMPQTYDPKVPEIAPDDVINWAAENIKSAQAVRNDVIASGDAAVSASAAALASSTGIRIARNSTSLHFSIFAVVKDDTNVGSFADRDSARFVEDFNPAGLGETTTKRALQYQNARKTKTRKTTLVLGPLPAFGLVCAVADAANAESMQRRRSLFADRLGSTIGANLLAITDNGLISKGLYSGPFDAEGAARKVVKIVENGTFTAALHNSYTANKANVPNTGHGMRTGGVSHTNLHIALGEKPARKLIEELEDGVYLELGGLSPNLTSGDISTNLDFAFKIEKGELAYPLANTMVSGNLLEILNNIDAVSCDYRYEPGNYLPTIRIRDVQISSAGD